MSFFHLCNLSTFKLSNKKTMKKTLLLFAILFCANQIKSQGFYNIAHAVDSLYPNDTTEDGPKAKVRRIFKRWDGQINAQGSFSTAAQNFNSFSNNLATHRSQNTNCSNDFVPTWKEIGPTMELNNANNLVGAGLIHRLTFHPNYGNSSFNDDQGYRTIYALSGFGGIWKTKDDGDSWERLNTDHDIPFSNMGNLVIDPINPNRMYLTTGTPNGAPDVSYISLQRDFPLYTTGIYGTDDGGVTWTKINNGISPNLIDFGGTIFNLKMDPTNSNNLIFTSTDGVYICKNANATLNLISWTKDQNFNFTDTKIQGLTYAYNGSNLEWYVSGVNIYYCINPFASVPNPWLLASGTSKNLDLSNGNYFGNVTKKIIQINIINSPFQANNIVYALIYIRERNPDYDPDLNPNVTPYFYEIAIHKLSIPNNTTTQWQNILYHSASDYATGLHSDKIPFVKSPNGNDFYFGSTHYGSFLNGNFTESYASNHHADIQGLYIHPNNPTKLWMCNDGGVSVGSVSTSHYEVFTYKNKGMQAQLLWDFDDSEQDNKYLLAALQDNGQQYIGGPLATNWKTAWFGGDGYEVEIFVKTLLMLL